MRSSHPQPLSSSCLQSADHGSASYNGDLLSGAGPARAKTGDGNDVQVRCRLGALLVLAFALTIPASASADRGFTSRFSANDTGDITFVASGEESGAEVRLKRFAAKLVRHGKLRRVRAVLRFDEGDGMATRARVLRLRMG